MERKSTFFDERAERKVGRSRELRICVPESFVPAGPAPVRCGPVWHRPQLVHLQPLSPPPSPQPPPPLFVAGVADEEDANAEAGQGSEDGQEDRGEERLAQ